jgi:UDP-N-acetylmuramoyl-L-alanine---L-glutamate ligase
MLLRDLRDARVAVWGAGVEGRAAVSLLQQYATPRSVSVIVDSLRPTDPSAIHGVDVIDLSSGAVVPSIDVILKSPGISPYRGALADLCAARPDVRVIGGTALWFAEAAAAPTKPLRRTIGVTGSKGKSTTSSLIAHLLDAVHGDVLLAGNVGRAPLDVLMDGLQHGDPFPASRWHVFELSSFQSSEVAHSPAVGVLTSLFPEHLDWHGTVDRYYADKLNLFRHGVESNTSVAANLANTDVSLHVHHQDDHVRVAGYGISPAFNEGITEGFWVDQSDAVCDGSRTFADSNAIPLVGRHNASNVCGALTALRLAGFEPWDHRDALLRSLQSFVPLPHRLQPVGVINGCDVIDDSLSTAPQAAVAALAAYAHRPVGIIVGGHDRGLDYSALADACAARTSPLEVVGVPESGVRIVQLITAAVSAANNDLVRCSTVDDFDAAPQRLVEAVPSGGVVLLSPAAPSFGRFADYKERGMRFRALLGLA